MKILLVSKYPPIEGGVSAMNYWLAKALGEKGAEISIITNALSVEEEYKETIDFSDFSILEEHQPKNVFFYSLEKKPPFHIPHSPAYLSRLINLGLKVIGERGADVIYANYLEPYASAGFVLKKITGLPLVIRHAGSDIHRILRSNDFRYFLSRVIQGADRLIFSPSVTSMAKALKVGEKKIISIPNTVNNVAFNPEGEKFDFEKSGLPKMSTETPIITYIGKATNHKGIPEIIDALDGLITDFRFLFVSNGSVINEFLTRVKSSKSLKNKFLHLGFVAPWVMPQILRASTAVVDLEHDFPVPIHSPIQPFEAISCETPVILSGEIFNKIKRRFPLSQSLFSVVENPKDQKNLKKVLGEVLKSPLIFKKRAIKIREEFLAKNNWEKYVNAHLTLFESISRKRHFWLF